MKLTLKKITDSTVNELLKNDIILPSTYFQCFDKHAKTLDVKIEEEEFEKDLNLLIAKEYEDINEYMSKTVCSIDKISDATQNVQNAILNKDETSLQRIYHEMDDLRKEIEEISNKIYKDTLTQTYNRKWLYGKYLKNNEFFPHHGVCVLANITDFNYINDKYGALICDSLLIFVSKFLRKSLNDEGVEYKIVKYIRGQFMIFIQGEPLKASLLVINNIKNLLSNTTLKNKSGILLKPNFNYSAASFYEKENFHECVEALEKRIKES